MPTSPRRCWPADQGSYIIGFILYVAYVIPRILQKFQTEGWHVVVDASCAPYWDLIQHLQSCAEKVCWGTHTLVELRSGSSCPPCFDVKMAEFGEAQNPGPSSSSSSGVLQPTAFTNTVHPHMSTKEGLIAGVLEFGRQFLHLRS